MGFVNNGQFPGQQEIDEWDSGAVHFIVRHRYTGHWLGGLRMVWPKERIFPFQERSATYKRISSVRYKNAVEISRLCMLKEAKRFASRDSAVDVPEESRKISFLRDYGNKNRNIMWGLYRAAASYSAQRGIKHWYMLSSPALAYFFNKQGFDIQQIGEANNRQSLRLPYCLNVKQVLDNPMWLEGYRNDFRLYSDIGNEFSVNMIERRQVKQIGVISFVSRM